MMLMRRRLACCAHDKQISIDFDEQENVSGMMTYNGLESCIRNNQSYENESRTSRGEGCGSDSLDDDFSTCSSSKDVSGSISSKWLTVKKEDECELSGSPQHFYVKGKPSRAVQFSSPDVETMKEKFAHLLLGEDITGGSKGVSTALALSNGIKNLAASIFGELWKLEPLPEEKKDKWCRELDWLLSPTNYMVELVPAKQNGANGRTLEIMTPKARADIHINLPALKKLDTMLIEALDSMVNNEFWYEEVGSRAEGRNKTTTESKRWWLPSPQVPKSGLSDTGRQKLLSRGKVVHQIFKAAKAINENVLLDMPIPPIICDALSKSGKENLGEDLYKILAVESSSLEDIVSSLCLESENSALEAINRLEAAVFAWKGRITEQVSSKTKSPIRASWSFSKDPVAELDKTKFLLNRAQALLQKIKSRYPNLPRTFLDSTKVQYGKDVGHLILEAYSRVLSNLAFRILTRIGEILQEDILSNPESPVATSCFPESPVPGLHVRRSLIHKMNDANGEHRESISSRYSDVDFSQFVAKTSSAIATTPGRSSRVWCIGKEACIGVSPRNSP